MSKVYKIIACFGCGVIAWSMYGQVTPQSSGLEANPKYRSLAHKEKQLHQVEDSIVRVITDTRKLFSTAGSNRDKLSADILRLENELFDIRDSIGIVVNQLGAIEQEIIANNLNQLGERGQETSGQPSAPAAKTQKQSLIQNDYFKENLSQEDYEALRKANAMESAPVPILQTYLNNYHRMKELASEYTVTSSRDTAEAAYERIETLRKLNSQLSDSLSGIWEYIYDNKTYAYNYLLDKLNKQQQLRDFESQYQQIVQTIAAKQEEIASESVFGYPLYRKLVLSYESQLANLLGYTQAKDSIDKVISQVNKLAYDLPRIEIEERNFIEYSDITTHSPSKYNSQNPIPEQEIHRKGTVFRIQLGEFSRKQPISIFRGVFPLCYDAMNDGRFRYSTGAFRTLPEAQQAQEQMKKLGFRKPEIVVWRDGVFEHLSETSSEGTSGEAPGLFFRVEIEGGSETLSDEIKQIVNESAPGKELTRAVKEDNTYVYTIGSFDQRESAEKLAQRIDAIAGISAKVLEIGN